MIKDPYSVLGVAQGATQDEIKKAYRRKAKENHPDLHPNAPNATQKMNEINEAYDMLMNPEKYKQRQEQEQARQSARQGYGGYGSYGGGYSGQGSQGQSSGYQGSYQQQGGYSQQSYDPFGFGFEEFFNFGQRQSAPTRPTPRPDDSPEFRRVIDSINAGQYQQAVIILNGVTSAGRSARWYYLAALAHNGMGNTTQALDFIRRAVQMNPNDPEIHRLWQQLSSAGQTYEEGARHWGGGFGMDRVCLGLCAANLLCNCLCSRGYGPGAATCCF